MKIVITADSVCDLSPQYIKEEKIHIFPLYIHLGDKEYVDGITITPKDIIEYLKHSKTLPKTSAVTVEDYDKVFSKLKAEGCQIIHFNISSEMSCSHQNALTAAKKYDDVYVVDSRTLSTGIGLLIMYACELRNTGKYSAKEIFEKVTERVPYAQASFVLDRLDCIYKGGRCSAIAYLGANLLMIRPSIEVKNGVMGIGHKQFGSLRHCLDKYVNDILSRYNNYDSKRIFMTYTDGYDPELVAMVRKIIEDKGIFKEVIETIACCTITSHCGQDCLGILYLNDGDHKL